MPPKVVGLGAPVSVWIYMDVSELPALRDAIGDELERHDRSARVDGHDSADADRCRIELQRMLDDVARAAATRIHGRFDVLWPTALARDVVRGAVLHAERRAAAASGDASQAASDALAAARRTLRDYEAVDNGGLDNVWL